MISKPILISGLAAVLAIGITITSSAIFVNASGETSMIEPDKPTVPRYSETCAHGHNGFDCNPPKYRTDIAELQKNTEELEKRVSALEKRR